MGYVTKKTNFCDVEVDAQSKYTHINTQKECQLQVIDKWTVECIWTKKLK